MNKRALGGEIFRIDEEERFSETVLLRAVRVGVVQIPVYGLESRILQVPTASFASMRR